MPTHHRSRLLACTLAALGACLAADPAHARHLPGPPARKATLGERAAAIALKEVGVPYRWGGASPAAGFDCSGLVYWSYRRLGIELPHSSYALYDQGRRVSPSHMRPGDLLFFYGVGHVGIYVGRGRMIHAPHSGTSVQVVRLGSSSYGARIEGVRRIDRR